MGASGSGRLPVWATPQMKPHILEARRKGVQIGSDDFTTKGNLRKTANERIYGAPSSKESTPKNQKTSKKKDLRIYTVLVEDHSGSMRTKDKAALTGVNEHIKVMGKEDSDQVPNYTARVEFDSKIVKGKFTRTSKMVTPNTYWTRGSTALNDALVAGINLLRKEVQKEKRFKYQMNVVVFTDGEENASSLYPTPTNGLGENKLEELREVILYAKKEGITIAVQGGSGSATWAKEIGIEETNIQIVDASTSKGVEAAMKGRTEAIRIATASYSTTGIKKEVGFFAT